MDSLLIGAVVWLIGLTIVVMVGAWMFARGYLSVVRENVSLKAELHAVRDAAKRELAALSAQFDLALSALRREVINARERWTIDAYALMDAQLYIQALEDTCHHHQIPLPKKPRRAGLDRPTTTPRTDDQHTGLDPIDELLSPLGQGASV